MVGDEKRCYQGSNLGLRKADAIKILGDNHYTIAPWYWRFHNDPLECIVSPWMPFFLSVTMQFDSSDCRPFDRNTYVIKHGPVQQVGYNTSTPLSNHTEGHNTKMIGRTLMILSPS